MTDLLCHGPIVAPWFPMSDTRIRGIKAAGTYVILVSGLLAIEGCWNGENWVTRGGEVLDEPWKWMPQP